ncbi:MAG: hypothetical protein IT242_10855 [Bacteroidia bacterium]|nr:hypothetical protein [Bacteroidia bacterium]
MKILRKMLLAEHTRFQTDRVVSYIGKSPARAADLVKLFCGKDKILAQRAAWALSHSGILFPELYLKHLPDILGCIQHPVHNSLKRNAMKLLGSCRIPDTLRTSVMDTCFQFIEDPAEPVSVKAYAMTVLEKFILRYPVLLNEFKAVLKSGMEFESAAYRKRAEMILANLEKRRLQKAISIR